jgi:hypothetical protein
MPFEGSLKRINMPKTIENVIEQRLTLDELRDTMEFQHLSPKMQMWVSSYVQNFLNNGTFDPVFATRTAYAGKNAENIRRIGYQMLSTPKVLFALNRFFGYSPEQAFRKAVEKAIYNRRLTNAQIRALELQCRMSGYGCANPPNRNGYKPKAAEPEAKVESETPRADETRQVPADALTVWSDKTTGVVIGYRSADRRDVKFQ